LPELELDMQTSHVLKLPALDEADAPSSVRNLISVFLSPDVGVVLDDAQIADRTRGQRLDGVLRFGDELVVVIESKIVGGAATDQAERLHLGGIQVESSRATGLGWHELLEDWWALLECGLLAPAERVLIEDLVSFTEDHFAHLLPFTTLGRAGEHNLRRQRRLTALLREATGLKSVEPDRPPQVGAWVMLDAATRSTQRISVKQDGDTLALFTYPAELKSQAKAFYRSRRVQRLGKFLAEHSEAWHARPNVHLAYWNARPAQRLYLTCDLKIAEYVRRWSTDDFAYIHSYPAGSIKDDLWPWLQKRGYASAEDDVRLDSFLERLGRREVHLRPSIAVRRSWAWPQAVELDERGVLAAAIRESVTELLTTLEEPLPPVCAYARSGAGRI
jgi:hypothetical protein